jgi:competence protein ComGC
MKKAFTLVELFVELLIVVIILGFILFMGSVMVGIHRSADKQSNFTPVVTPVNPETQPGDK